MLITKRGQSIMEYVILLVIVIGAFVATSSYVKRGIQGRWKQAVDGLGEQYDPTIMVTHITYTLNAQTMTKIESQPYILGDAMGLMTNRTDFSNSVERKAGQSQVGSY